MTDDRAALLGRYLGSLTPRQRSVCARRVQVITDFLEAGAAVDREGYRGYLKGAGGVVPLRDREILNDFLRHCGVEAEVEVVPRREAKALRPEHEADIAAFIEWSLQRADYSTSTVRQRSAHMRLYFSRYETFSHDNCREYMAVMEAEGRHPRTLNLYVLTLRRYAEFSGQAVNLRRIKVPRELSVENVPTREELEVLLRECRRRELWTEYWCVKALASTGMRRSELRQVTWRDVVAGMTMPKGKGNKYRRVFFPRALSAEAKEWATARNIDMVRCLATHQDGRPLSERGLDYKLKSVARLCGYPLAKAHCHALRHFFAKQYLAATGNVIQLSELLGHESVETTRLYLQKSTEEQRGDIDRAVTWI